MIRNATCSLATFDERSRERTCRLCQARLATTFVDLGMSPLCESFLTADQIDRMEPYFPLHVLVCDR
jgi:Putative zinc binding domain